MRPKMKLFAVELKRILEVLCLRILQKKFVRPKTKLFAVKSRLILQILYLQYLQKRLWARFDDMCVRKRTCFP